MIRIATPADVGPALTQLRGLRGATRGDVAFALGMWQSQYGQYELGAKLPSAINLIRLVHALGYDLALVPREDAP